VTTGGTLVTACKRVADAGLTISGVYCVLDREEGGAENLASGGFDLKSIFTRKALLAAAQG
jgi:orotate phosphoribosyltransferase